MRRRTTSGETHRRAARGRRLPARATRCARRTRSASVQVLGDTAVDHDISIRHERVHDGTSQGTDRDGPAGRFGHAPIVAPGGRRAHREVTRYRDLRHPSSRTSGPVAEAFGRSATLSYPRRGLPRRIPRPNSEPSMTDPGEPDQDIRFRSRRTLVASSGRPRRRQEQAPRAILAIDLHLVHEVTSPAGVPGPPPAAGLTVRQPERTVATADHARRPRRSLPILDQQAAFQVAQLERNCDEFGIPVYSRGSDHQGIVHVIGPELGLTQPGMTIVCGDFHTATHGAFGALAFGIGTSEVEMVLATQTLLQRHRKTRGARRRHAADRASRPRTSSSTSSRASAWAAAPATCSSTPARPSGACRWKSA